MTLHPQALVDSGAMVGVRTHDTPFSGGKAGIAPLPANINRVKFHA